MRKLLVALSALMIASAVGAEPLTEAVKTEVVANAARLLEQRYVDAGKGKKLAERLIAERRRWNSLDDPAQFAKAVTDWLRRESGDGHLGLSYSEAAIPIQNGADQFSEQEMLRWYGPQLNHGVEKIERLDGNIMLLDLRVFPPPEMGGDVIAAAMNLVAQGDALIIDLRKNAGGAETAELVVAYLVEGGSPLSGYYDRPTDTHHYISSPNWVPGRRFGTTKPVYVLTSRDTFSAAEAVAYNLQALKRAVIVGERTGGGAHPFEYRRVHAHFALDLPEAKSINPITGGNWQGVGVKPDVEIPAERALAKAIELARVATSKGRSEAASGPRSLP